MSKSRVRLAGGAILAALSLAAVASPAAAAGPDPASAYIERIAYGGAGCPQGTLSLSFSDDRLSVTAIPGQFVVSIGPGGGLVRKTCTLSMIVHGPQVCEWTSTRATVTIRGHQQLAAGVASTRTTSMWVSTGSIDTATHQTSGPSTGDIADTDAFLPNIPNVASSPPVNVKSDVRLTSSGTTQANRITVDAIEIALTNATSPLEQLACGLGLEPIVDPVLDLLRP